MISAPLFLPKALICKGICILRILYSKQLKAIDGLLKLL